VASSDTFEIALLQEDLESRPAEAVLAWALDCFGSRIALAASFGAEDVVLIDMLAQIHQAPRVFTLDTGRLPSQTYSLMETLRERYGLTFEVYFPKAEAVEGMVRERGVNLFYRSIADRHRCCGIRKVDPLDRALGDLDAWITGLRREQATTRAQVGKVEVDRDHRGLIKVNPLADWTWQQVWAYIRARGVPYHSLHDQGYPSIGCAPCTRPVAAGEDLRAGRWWWEQGTVAKECGLHPAR
jgi:phosphoadenosine phosphosulfate reductase